VSNGAGPNAARWVTLTLPPPAGVGRVLRRCFTPRTTAVHSGVKFVDGRSSDVGRAWRCAGDGPACRALLDSALVSVPEQLATRLADGDRRALARSITLVESTRSDHRSHASALLDAVLDRTGGAIRLGITGTPGAGKSTFIEELGGHLTAAGHRVAVLAVDPSSRRSGGSILGDKTRMERLARDPNAFIRPSPSGGSVGGVARRTREAALLCEAAGFDVIVVETVGVGQSEVAVADMVDCFCLIAAPGAGDELQGIKRGIMELADVVVVNKADGDLLPAARRAMADYRQAAHLLRPKHAGWEVPVLAASALQGTGVDDVWSTVEKFVARLREGDALGRLRAGQAVAWMWDEIRERLVDSFRQDPGVAEHWSSTEAAVRAGRLSPTTAARRLLDAHGVDAG
jgi:GTPase